MRNMNLRYCPHVQSAHCRRKRGRGLGCLIKLQLHWRQEAVWILCVGWSWGGLPVESFRSWCSAGLCWSWRRQQGGSSVVGTQDVVWTCRWRTSAWAFRLRNSSWMKSVNVFLISIWGEQNKLFKTSSWFLNQKNDSGFWVCIVRTIFEKKERHQVVQF